MGTAIERKLFYRELTIEGSSTKSNTRTKTNTKTYNDEDLNKEQKDK